MPAYKDKKNGKWYCKFYYKDWTGIRRQKWKRGFPTKREAKIYERDFLQQQVASPDILFQNLYEVYLEEMSVRLKHSTILIKKNICETKILPYFRDKMVNEITAADVRRWQNELMKAENHYSETYLKTINNQMSAIINYAIRYYNLAKNPCEQAGSIGANRADRMQYWTLDEFLAFREGICDKKVSYLCFEILYWTGIRSGELPALTPADIDFQKKEIHIEKTYQRIQGADVITKPKTRKSNRSILMPDFLCEELCEGLKSLSDDTMRERLFPFTRYFLNYEMKRGCERTGIKKIRIHDLRHSHVSLLINLGFDALIIAERVGHENVSTTLNTYAHLFPNRQTALVLSLEKLGRREEEWENSSNIVAEKETMSLSQGELRRV